MGEVHKPEPVKLIVGALSGYEHAFDLARRVLVGRYGPIDVETALLRFDFTDYYEAQMGGGLLRKFFAFREVIDPAILADVKVWANRMEAELGPAISTDVPRPINLDPGYVTPAKLVLASTKDFSHRVYLRDGIYAEVTLHYEKGGSFRAFPWTFPDYKASPGYHAFLLEARRKLMEQLREVQSSKCKVQRNG